MKTKTTNNPNGRPKGTANPLSASIREQIRSGIASNDIVSKLFAKLNEIKDPYKFVQTVLSVLDLVLPRLAAEQTEVEVGTKKDLAAVMEMVHNKLQANTDKLINR